MDQHPNEIRGPIEADFNRQRADLEEKYVEDKVALEQAYHADVKAINKAKSEQLVAAGLNPDGSVVSTRGRRNT